MKENTIVMIHSDDSLQYHNIFVANFMIKELLFGSEATYKMLFIFK